MKKMSHEFDLTNVKSDVNIYRKEESFKILKACFEVHKELGNGFLEPVYQEALELEFKNQNIPFLSVIQFLYRPLIIHQRFLLYFEVLYHH